MVSSVQEQQPNRMKNNLSDTHWKKWLTFCVYGNALVLVLFGLYYFLIPSIILIQDIREPALYTGKMPGFVYRWHQELSGKYVVWARERVAS